MLKSINTPKASFPCFIPSSNLFLSELTPRTLCFTFRGQHSNMLSM